MLMSFSSQQSSLSLLAQNQPCVLVDYADYYFSVTQRGGGLKFNLFPLLLKLLLLFLLLLLLILISSRSPYSLTLLTLSYTTHKTNKNKDRQGLRK